ncbi:CHAT domain-containing protein [Zavarzinia sp. CC-PAN008]|uniref:CHAT domain-containing protein n=1 Tax=Zavarzinia sp. CC-PAN008 TaxID=3243332 RepID=UPI003F744944
MVGVLRHLVLASAALMLAGALAGCGAVTRAIVEKDTVEGSIVLGANLAGEACTGQKTTGDGLLDGTSEAYVVRCGDWEQPSGRVFVANGVGGSLEALEAQVTGGPLRTFLDPRMTCDPVERRTLMSGLQAAVAQCRLLRGGWPAIAFAVETRGRLYLAQGIPASQPALETVILVASGEQRAVRAEDGGIEARIAQAQAATFGAGDLKAYYNLFTVGAYYDAVTRFEAAEAAYREALAINQRLVGTDVPGNADAAMHLALELSNQGEYDDAEALFKASEGWLANQPASTEQARLLSYRSFHAANQKLSDRALDLARQASDMRRRLLAEREQESVGDDYGGLITTASPGLATSSSVAALKVELAQSQYAEAALLFKQGKVAEADAVVKDALSLLEGQGHTPEWWPPRYVELEADIQESKGDLPLAETLRRQAADDWRLLFRDSRRQGLNGLALARIVAAQGRTAEALQIGREALDGVRRTNQGLKLEDISGHLALLKADADAHPERAVALHDEMLETLSVVREGVTAKSIALATARLSSGDRAVSGLIRQKQDIDLKRYAAQQEFNRLVAIDPQFRDAALVDATRAQIQALDSETADIEQAIQSASPEYGQLVDLPVRAAEVRGLLQRDEAVVMLTMGVSNGWVMIVTSDEVVPYPVAISGEQVRDLVRNLRAGVDIGSDGSLSPFDVASAHDLYRTLFGPGEAALAGRERLTLVPSKDLLVVPLQILVTEPPPPIQGLDYRQVAFMARSHTLSVVPSLRSYVGLRTQAGRSAAPKALVGFGDFVPGQVTQSVAMTRDARMLRRSSSECRDDADVLSQMPALPGTKSELETIAQVVPGAGTDLVMEGDFTKARLKSMALDQYRVVYFATHGLLAEDLACWRQPSLVLSTPPGGAASPADILLDAGEILDLKLDADLVVLSACNTAAGNGEASGESLSGLVRSFLYAGARSAVASHWPVPDESTGALIPGIFRAYESHMDQGYAAALAASQRQLLARAGADLPVDWSHPLFWAAFSFVGTNAGGAVGG